MKMPYIEIALGLPMETCPGVNKSHPSEREDMIEFTCRRSTVRLAVGAFDFPKSSWRVPRV